MAIRSIKHRALRRLFETGNGRGLDAQMLDKLEAMLSAIDLAAAPEDAEALPGWRLHQLRGDLAGYWSLTVTGNWRLIFRFEEGHAQDLDLIDYH